MDLQRLFLFIIFSFSLVLVWDGWQRYQHPQDMLIQQPVSNVVATSASLIQKTNPIITQNIVLVADAKIITVKTDTLLAEISTVGGDIQKLSFLKHPDGVDKTKPFVLFEKGTGTHNYSEQSGLLGPDLPNHNTVYAAEQDAYVLAENSDKLDVRLTATSANGVKVIKTITFHKGGYLTDISFDIENLSSKQVATSAYFQLVRDHEAPAGATKFVPTYTGAAVFTEKDKLQKVDFSSIDKNKLEYPKESDNGWIGILQHYFVSAWIPKVRQWSV
jgi:YidC/Oxa1 family membrane protein insertase